MTTERKMRVVAWGDLMAACNLLMRKREAEKEGRQREEKLHSKKERN